MRRIPDTRVSNPSTKVNICEVKEINHTTSEHGHGVWAMSGLFSTVVLVANLLAAGILALVLLVRGVL